MLNVSGNASCYCLSSLEMEKIPMELQHKYDIVL